MHMKLNKITILILCTLIVTVSCASQKQAEPITMDEYLALNKSEWFLTGKTSYEIQGMLVSKDTDAYNFFEDTHYVVRPNGEDVLLKGTAGELWRSNINKVKQTYTKTDGSEINNSDFVNDKYLTLKTKATEGSNYAYFIPKEYTILVNTSWGDILTANRDGIPHGDGDYLISSKNEDGSPNLDDVWVVNGILFPKTYNMDNAKK